MKVVFITLYNESARGMRFVAAAVAAAGHSVSIVHVKHFRSVTIARRDAERLAWAMAQMPWQIREVTGEGERFHPYPSPVTETEERLLAELLDRLKPDVIGFSFATHAQGVAARLTALVRQSRPGVPILWGGIHAIVDPEESLAHADAVCVGEGEEAVPQWLADPSRTDVAGLWFRNGRKLATGEPIAERDSRKFVVPPLGGEWPEALQKTEEPPKGGTTSFAPADGAIRNAYRPLIQDLDRLAWPLYGGDEYEVDDDTIQTHMADLPGLIRLSFYTETTRGCPFACSYCIHSIARARYPGQPYIRRRSLENVMAEIQAFRRRFGLQEVLPFFDEILLMNKRRFARFAALYRREIHHPFCGFAHHKTTDREMLALAREAGIAETSIGVQTGSERIARDIYRRPIDRAATIRLARDIHELGAGRLILNILCDCAFEREEDLRATFGLLQEMPRPYLLQLSRLVPFPQTPIAAMPCDLDPLPQSVRDFWNLLYLLTQRDDIDRADLEALAADPYLREHPAALDGLVHALFRSRDNGAAAYPMPCATIAPPATAPLWARIVRKLLARP